MPVLLILHSWFFALYAKMRLWVSSYPIVNQSEEPNELKTVFCGFPVQFHELVPAHSVLKARERSMEGSRTFHFTTGCLTSLVLK